MKINIPDKIFGVEMGLIKIFLLPLLILFLIFLSLRFVILPRINDLMKMNSQIADIQNQTKLTQEKINYLTALDKNKLNKDVDFLNNALLREKNTYLLVRIIRAISENYGFSVRSFLVNPGELKTSGIIKKTGTDVLTKIPVDLVVIGPKNKYLDLISALEKSLPVLVIENFQLKSAGDVAELSLKVSSFYIGSKVEADLKSIGLADLTLNKSESEVLTRLNQFIVNKNVLEIQTENTVQKEAVKYTRDNPFNL